MPFVRIDVNQGRTPVELRALSRGIHHAIVADYGIPERDYFHVLTEHPAGQILAQDAGLGFERTPDVVMIQIFTQAGRSQEAKQSMFASITEKLAVIGVAGEDVFIGYVENTAGDWSFGFVGRSTPPVSSASPASSPQGLRPLPATRPAPGRHSGPPCHVVNMSVQTFDST
ncbi:phenylpyruvate tautomerase PptA (4-oxalocrotonate tautomerase family) [Arthrobacter sp. MP_M7]|nr:phenylpyruvate tautomerase PptA (4-oxalocrotonate tautomerase family) [Arthrobacter sp. MP_M4]MEC5203635.1 phenylpyruvate tautomerase PptA (4-oxalocrotonate tautomerase family) [Arthrobacter sp. MP_M7]